jgi:hypothetical protein
MPPDLATPIRMLQQAPTLDSAVMTPHDDRTERYVMGALLRMCQEPRFDPDGSRTSWSKPLKWICFFAALLAIIVIPAFNAIQRSNHVRWDQTQRELTSLAGRLQGWIGLHHEPPKGTFRSALELLAADEDLAKLEQNYYPLRHVLSGKDAWGQDLIYDVREGEQRIIVRSVGSNGRDEYGKGDDIQVEAHWW